MTVPELRGKGASATSRVLLESGKTYGNRLVKIDSMELKVPAGATVAANQISGNFEVVFERVSRAYTGQKTVTKGFPLTLELDGSNNFKGCRATFDSVALGVKEEICREIGGAWIVSGGTCSVPDCPGGKILTKDSGSLTCVYTPVANKQCGLGKYLKGFNNQGDKLCEPCRRRPPLRP